MKTLVGLTLQTEEGIRFTVQKERYWAEGSHNPKDYNGRKLDAMQAGYLMSVSYQGHPTPFLRVPGGVFKPERIEVNGERIDGASKISKKLGIGTTQLPKRYEKIR